MYQPPHAPPPGIPLRAPGWSAWAPPPRAVPAGTIGTVGVGRDDQVSGEAVALELPAANIGLRILSGLLDVLVTVVVLVVLWVLIFRAGIAGRVDFALFMTFGVLASVIAFVVIPTTLETLTRGKTLGHYALGLRTVRDDAGPIQFRHALARALMGYVEIYLMLGVPALVVGVSNRRGKRVGDLLAGTYVIRDRASMPARIPAQMPPGLADWAASADIGAVPSGVTNSVRHFLSGRDEMPPPIRESLAHRLVWFVAPYVSPAPPPGVHPEEVLCAVMAERRNRGARRLQREAATRARILRTH